MTLRVPLLATLVLTLGPASAAVPAARPAGPMVFYVVKGAPGACGRGCDSWIAVEGQIDSGAALRFRKFYSRVRDRNLPIYLYSPGGNLDQALAMGTMLREKPVMAGVARTVVRECGFEAQDSDACLRLKQSGRELQGDLWTRGATCNSACPYLMLGATTREIAPDALLAVHSPKVVPHFRGGVPTREMRAAATERGLERADRMLTSYITKMGANLELLDLARTIKFESMHVLTREEIVRFAIDRRERVETPWTFENSARSTVRKTAVQRAEGDKTWRMSQWRLLCFNADQLELQFQRQAGTSPTFATVSISNDGPAPLYFATPPTKAQGFDIWGLRMTRAAVQRLADMPQFDFTETSQGADGRRLAHSAKLSTDGLARALATLIETCPPPKNIVLRQTIGSRDSAAK